jgi:hypothetical protein
MTSEKQIEANRQNAKQSTGPKTPEGKAKVAGNAIKHGLRAQTNVLPDVESEEDWEEHVAEVRAYWAPVGYMEEVLTKRIAEMLWRLRRATYHFTQAQQMIRVGAEADR